MKSLLVILSIITFVAGVNALFNTVEEGMAEYRLANVCVKQHIALGIERKDITSDLCPGLVD